jgi:hypothetical protein
MCAFYKEIILTKMSFNNQLQYKDGDTNRIAFVSEAEDPCHVSQGVIAPSPDAQHLKMKTMGLLACLDMKNRDLCHGRHWHL